MILFFQCVFASIISFSLLILYQERRKQVRKRKGSGGARPSTPPALGGVQRLAQIHREFQQSLRALPRVTKDSTQCSDSTVLEAFRPIQSRVCCTFAKGATVWAPRHANDLDIPLLTRAASDEGRCAHLDGFLVQIRTTEPIVTEEDMARVVGAVLAEYSAADPAGVHCVRLPGKVIESRHWAFEFNGESFFVTTFSHLYGKDHPRYTYGECDDRSVFILLQPEYSFAYRGLDGSDHAVPTNYAAPRTDRDKIRAAFRAAGQDYVRDGDPGALRAAHQMVRGADDAYGARVVDWWSAPAALSSLIA